MLPIHPRPKIEHTIPSIFSVCTATDRPGDATYEVPQLQCVFIADSIMAAVGPKVGTRREGNLSNQMS